MTPDFHRLQMASLVLGDLWRRLAFRIIEDPHWREPSDTSYLTDEDRANPDFMANVVATERTNQQIAWFGRDADGYLGLWRGSNQGSLDVAPIVRLNTEGQYVIVAKTIPDYFAGSVSPSEFTGVKRTLEALGFQVAPSFKAIYSAVEAIALEPSRFRNTHYQQERLLRGLPSM